MAKCATHVIHGQVCQIYGQVGQTQKLFSDSDSEIIYSATYHRLTIFTYIWFQYNGPRRPSLRQNYVAGMGATHGGQLHGLVYHTRNTGKVYQLLKYNANLTLT